MEERHTKKGELTEKQLIALEMLVSGKGYTYKEIGDTVGVCEHTIYKWRKGERCPQFKEAYDEMMDAKWHATVEAARQAAFELCRDKNQKMVEFVLKNDGLNPSQKVEAEVNNEIIITIGD